MGLEDKQQAKLKEEEKFVAADPHTLVDAGKIKRETFFSGLTNGAAKGAMWGGILLVGLVGLGVAAVLSGGTLLTMMTAVGAWAGVKMGAITLGSLLPVVAGTIGLGAAIGGITGAGSAMAEADEKVEEEVASMRRKQQMVAQRRLQRRELALNAEAQELEFQKQSLQMGLSPNLVGMSRQESSTRDVS